MILQLFLNFQEKSDKEPSLRWVGWEEIVRGREGGKEEEKERVQVGGKWDWRDVWIFYMYMCVHVQWYAHMYCTRSGARSACSHSFYLERVVSSFTNACGRDNSCRL